jgi:hypothetical protein
MSMEGGNGPIPKPKRESDMNTMTHEKGIRALSEQELDLVSGGLDVGKVAGSILHTLENLPILGQLVCAIERVVNKA